MGMANPRNKDASSGRFSITFLPNIEIAESYRRYKENKQKICLNSKLIFKVLRHTPEWKIATCR